MGHPSLVRQVLPHGVMLAACGWLWWAASRIEGGSGGRIGPDVWPKAIIAIMALLCAYEIVKRLLLRRATHAQGLVAGLQHQPIAIAPAEPAVEEAPFAPRKLGAGIVLVLAYVALVPYAGFFVTTALFLALFPWAGGMRRPALVAALAVAGSLVLVVIFMRVAYISLPLGEGPFRALSLALLRLLGVS
jgi:putative tricarboxylic transport membrane protein